MLYRQIAKLLGYYFLIFSLALCIPLILALYFQFFLSPAEHPQPHSAVAFFKSFLICLGVGCGLMLIGEKKNLFLYRREGLAAVVLIWFATPAIGALPFYLSGTLEKFSQSYFEAASGFSTTGLSVMEAKRYDPETGEEVPIVNTFCGIHETTYQYWGTITPVRNPETGQIVLEGLEAVSPAVLFWRCFLQWLGGLGIIILFVILLPILGVGGKVLFQTAIPTPVQDSFTPRIKENALVVWKIYLVFSLIETLFLLAVNPEMTWFEAVTLTFSTISTGGFSVHTQSVGYYQDGLTEWVILLFMLLGSVNFSLYFYAIRGKLYRLFEPELILYGILLFVFSFFVVSAIVGSEKFTLQEKPDGVFNLREAIRYGVFQLISAQTSTGFTTYNYTTWPYVAQAVMLVVMFVGGMSGSTAGGMKVVRQYMLFCIARDKVEWMFRPEAVRTFRIGSISVNVSAVTTVLCFFLIATAVSVLGTILYIMDGIDPRTSLGLVACNVNNIGISFMASGPGYSAAFLPPFSTIFSTVLMLLGRLEFYAVLVILVPAFWQENR